MNIWLVPSNNSFFRLTDLLTARNVVSWRQSQDFEVGDIIYIYTTKPTGCITHQMVVSASNLPSSKYTDDKEYWTNPEVYNDVILSYKRFAEFTVVHRLPTSEQLSYSQLKKHGLKTVQITHRIKADLAKYIDTCILQLIKPDLSASPDFLDDTIKYQEGAVMQVLINKFERNSEARRQCIEAHGCYCHVCGLDFAKMYGEIGDGFIHVHHIVPLSSIGAEYNVDPIKDLIPVCPNCHAMLHRQMNGEMQTVEQLRKSIASKGRLF